MARRRPGRNRMNAISSLRRKGSNSKDSRLTSLRQDGVAGIINAAVSVPDGLASAALAGANPVYGLYTSIAAPLCGSPIMSAQLMQIATTSASALMARQAVVTYPVGQRDQALFLLVVLTEFVNKKLLRPIR
jgi:SulP family sulfate permease